MCRLVTYDILIFSILNVADAYSNTERFVNA